MNRRKFVESLSTFISSSWLWGGSTVLAGPRTLRKGAGHNPASPSQAGPPGTGGVVPGNQIWPRPVLIPLPKEVAGVSHPLLDLAGTWKLIVSPPADFWLNSVDPAGWSDILVPGELVAQGIPLARDNEFAYKRAVKIPAEAKGNKVILRFDGVYSYARVWVNGKFVRDHHGGFTSWDCDVTDCVTPGQTAWIAVGVTDRSDDISYASSYAKHYIGGILRSVRLVILPPDHVSRLHVETDFDSSHKDGRLHVMAEVAVHTGRAGELKLHLADARGKAIPLSTAGDAALAFSPDKPRMDLHFLIPSPRKWDAEHPTLYTLEAELMVDGSSVEKL
jgi:beta-galactosidase/beta-glucuronidase